MVPKNKERCPKPTETLVRIYQKMPVFVTRTCREAYFFHLGHFESDFFQVWKRQRQFASVEVKLPPYSRSRSGKIYLSTLEEQIYRTCTDHGLKVKRIHVGQFFVYGIARSMKILKQWRKAMLDFPDDKPWVKHAELGQLYEYPDQEVARFVAKSKKANTNRKKVQTAEDGRNKYRPPSWVWQMPLDSVLEFPQDPRKRIRKEKGIE